MLLPCTSRRPRDLCTTRRTAEIPPRYAAMFGNQFAIPRTAFAVASRHGVRFGAFGELFGAFGVVCRVLGKVTL